MSDFFIGKPGPGSISEAMQQGLPVIVVRNAWTMPQERYNAEWVEENGAGLVLDSFKIHSAAVQQLTASIDGVPRAECARIHNRAVFEIPEILERILDADRSTAPRRVGVDFIQHFRAARAPASDLGSSRAAAERSADGADGRKALRVRQHGGEHRGIAAGQAGRGLMKESLRGGFCAVDAVAELGDIQIHLQDAPLRPAGLDQHREIGLEPLRK